MIGPLSGKAAEEGAKLMPEVYRDLAKPAVQEVGSLLGRTIRMALAPVRGVVWTLEHAEDWLHRSVEERFARREVPAERIVTPSPQLLDGVIRGVQASSADPDSTLRDSFANLLATAMDAERTSLAHPAFAEVLSQLAPGEARALHALARRNVLPLIWQLVIRRGMIYEHHLVLAKELGWEPAEVSSPYLGNLTRLGILKSEAGVCARETDVQGVRNDGNPADWIGFREILRRYDSQPVTEVLDRFELLCRDAKPGAKLALIYVRATPTPFGAQMLRAIMDPADLKDEQLVAISRWETETNLLDLK